MTEPTGRERVVEEILWEFAEDVACALGADESTTLAAPVPDFRNRIVAALEESREPVAWLVEYQSFGGAPTKSYFERSGTAAAEFVEGAKTADYSMARAVPLYATPTTEPEEEG